MPALIECRLVIATLRLLSAYPVHLAVGGDEWVNCVVDQYPM